jgi:murein DD-endopeptidase MepM/ murein hydrolase activator NlpD
MLNRGGKSSSAIPLIWFCLIAIWVLGSTASGSQRRPRHSRKSGKALVRSLSQVKSQKKEAKAELKVTRIQAVAMKVDIAAADAKLESTIDTLENIRGRLGKAKLERAHTASELSKVLLQLAQTKRMVQARIRAIYMQGDQEAISAVAGTKTAGEVAAQGFLMGAIERKDREVFDRYTELKREVAIKKRREDEIIEEVTRLEGAEVDQTHVLSNDRKTKSKLLKNLQAKQQSLEQMIHQFNRDEEQITAQIDAFERSRRTFNRGRVSHRGSFSGRFLRPVNGPITSTFGMRFHPILHRVRMHTGIDFGASYGTPIHAAAGGEIIYANFMGGYGRVVIIDHGGGFSTVYGHSSRIFVSVGQHVAQGQVIAAVGASGLATGPHLHFEIRVNGRPVNPIGKF